MEEQIDILDNQGNKTGEVISKKEVHARGEWHRTVHVWFLNSQHQLLLQRRAKNKDTFPGAWDISAAGHISAGQTSIEAAQRETYEEIGVTIQGTELVFIATITTSSTFRGGTYFDNEFNDIYLVRKDVPLSAIKIQESEVEEVRYIDVAEFKKWVEDKRPDLVPHEEEYKKLFEFLKR